MIRAGGQGLVGGTGLDAEAGFADEHAPAAHPGGCRRGQGFQVFAAAAHDDGCVGEKKGAVGAELGGEGVKAAGRQVEAGKLGERAQGGHGVAAATAETGADGDAFLQSELHRAVPPGFGAEEGGGTQDEVGLVGGHVRGIAKQPAWAGLIERAGEQGVAPGQGGGDGDEVVKAVGSPAGDGEREI